MIRPLAASLSIAGGLLLAACSLFTTPVRDSEPLPPRRADASGVPTRHLTQLDFGRRAHYAVCRDANCPTVTPKTLAPVAAVATQPVAVEARGTSPAAPAPISPSPLPSGFRP